MRGILVNLAEHRVLRFICRIVLGAVFIYAALGKISNPTDFADAVAAYRIIPISCVNVFAITLPWLEFLVGLALLSGHRLREAALLSVVLNLVFITAVSSAMARGLDIECGCFTLSKAHSSVGWQLLARDVLFIVLALPVLCHSTGKVPAQVTA